MHLSPRLPPSLRSISTPRARWSSTFPGSKPCGLILVLPKSSFRSKTWSRTEIQKDRRAQHPGIRLRRRLAGFVTHLSIRWTVANEFPVRLSAVMIAGLCSCKQFHIAASTEFGSQPRPDNKSLHSKLRCDTVVNSRGDGASTARTRESLGSKRCTLALVYHLPCDLSRFLGQGDRQRSQTRDPSALNSSDSMRKISAA